MSSNEIKLVAAELATAREGLPKRSGAIRQRISYSPAIMARAVRLFRRSGQRPAAFARQLGISPSALMRWAGDNEASEAFIPILPETGAVEHGGLRPKSKNTMPESARITASVPLGSLVVRETVISFPADLDPSRIREIMSALRGGVPC